MTNKPRKKPNAPRAKATDGAKRTSEDRGQAFIHAYLSNGHNATQAAIAAGYSPKTAQQKGSNLLHRPDILERLNAERDRLAKENKVTVEKIAQELAKIAFGTDRDTIKMKALELLGKTLGMFVEKVEQKNTFTDADGNPTLPTVKVVFVNPSKETPSAE